MLLQVPAWQGKLNLSTMETILRQFTRMNHHLQPDTGKWHYILTNGQLLYLIHDRRQLPCDERVQQEIRLHLHELKKSGLVAVKSKSESMLAFEQE